MTPPDPAARVVSVERTAVRERVRGAGGAASNPAPPIPEIPEAPIPHIPDLADPGSPRHRLEGEIGTGLGPRRLPFSAGLAAAVAGIAGLVAVPLLAAPANLWVVGVASVIAALGAGVIGYFGPWWPES